MPQVFTPKVQPPLDAAVRADLTLAANAIRNLAIDTVQKANSGHPGLPMGCAELGAYLFGQFLRFCPSDPRWLARDRFILSAGHGSALQYICLHLTGFDLTLEDLQQFRQLHSKTPGHPEAELTPGIETTTGPLGQGVGHAVGQALGLKLLHARFATPPPDLDRAKVVVIAGDGCMMEGVGAEASSLAGHLQLNNLVVIYDANSITLDGPLSDSCSEDTELRYRAYGWDVVHIDGHDLQAIHDVFCAVREQQSRPILIIAKTIIGKGSPHKAGSHKAHGSPLGSEEVALVKRDLGFPAEAFFVPQETRAFFSKRVAAINEEYARWKATFGHWQQTAPSDFALWRTLANRLLPDLEKELEGLEVPTSISGRAASQAVIGHLAKSIPYLIGGSADLSGSDLTAIRESSVVSAGKFSGRNLKFGVREFAMATIAVGLGQTDLLFPFIGTFLTFSDYMRNAIRLSALMRCRMVYQFTHDSIFLGEDGPTHQPVEHLAALRAIPQLCVHRPADSNEVKGAWIAALRYLGPTAIALSRQNLPTFAETKLSYEEGVGRGAYVLRKGGDDPDVAIFATGSEVSLAISVADQLEGNGKLRVCVVSAPCWELFFSQSTAYQKEVLHRGRLKVSIEAASSMGWHRFVGVEGLTVSVDTFGASAPIEDLQGHFGFNAEAICARISKKLAETQNE